MIEMWAIVSLENGSWNIVGLWTPEMGHMPAVSTSKENIDLAWQFVDPEVRNRAKIIHLAEVN